MSIQWTEKLNIALADENNNSELEIENPDGEDVYIYKVEKDKDGEPVKRNFIGTISVETFLAVCKRANDMWLTESQERHEPAGEQK